MLPEQLHWICFGVGAWVALNGVLHTIAVMNQHKGAYTREYMRLLMDGLLLVLCGAIQMVSHPLIGERQPAGFILAGIASAGLFIYTLLIYPFLKSFFTMIINVALLILLTIGYVSL